MSRRLVVLLTAGLVVGACSSDDAATSSTAPDEPVATTTTLSPRAGLVPDPAAIEQAVRDGTLDAVEADLALTLGMWGRFESVPIDFLAPVEAVGAPQWDHMAASRLISAWGDLDVVTRSTLLTTIDGFDELVGESTEEPCIPTPADGLEICIGASVEDEIDVLDTVEPWVDAAAADAWAAFTALFGTSPSDVRLYLSDLHADGSVAGHDWRCHAHVDVSDPEQPGGAASEDRIRSAVAHQLFHCFQDQQPPQPDPALFEGTAVWAEHHVYPSANSELPWLAGFVTDPIAPFDERRYDAAFAFLYADQRHGPGAVVDALAAGSVAGLRPSEDAFADLWHAISVAAWNTDPAPALVDDGDFIAASVGPGAVALQPLGPETAGDLAFALAPFSRDLQSLEFLASGSAADLANFARLRLDLSGVPRDVRVSALAETADGWLGPIELTGDEWLFCRAGVGVCGDADVETIAAYTRLVLVVTNVDNGTERFSIPWETYNPRLDGTWVRIDGPLLTEPGETAPYAIVGTELTFLEVAGEMVEDTAAYTLQVLEPGWSCSLGGAYVIGVEATYEAPGPGDVDGTVAIDASVGDGGTFDNRCTFTDESGAESTGAGLHVPLAWEETFGFEIRGYDTLWIYAADRIYVYERVR